MSTLSRFGPAVARSLIIKQHRNMASVATASDPIHKLFVEKIREVKTSSKGLDEKHQKQMNDEMLRLKRVYQVDDDKKLAHMEHKFVSEVEVSLRDVDANKEMRSKIHSGEYQKQLIAQAPEESTLMASIPDQTVHEFCLPPLNKPDPDLLIDNMGVPSPATLEESRPDYERPGDKLTAAQLERDLLVHFGDKMPTIHDDDAPQRDKVNYPRQPPLQDCPPTRYHIIPESWFQFFYSKTGVTGPYAFAGAFGAFLFSKEWLVMEHEMLTAFSSVCIFGYAIPKYGPAAKAWLMNIYQKDIDGWDNWQKGNSETLAKLIDHYKASLTVGGETLDEIYKARRQDVDVQLEQEYRARLKTIYDDTKRRLNYLVAVADSQRQIQHSNLVNTVISNVMNSLGPKQENEVLDDCIINLRQLASKNANAI